MEINVVELLHSSDVLLLFTALAFGFLLGRVKIGSFELGPTTGVLICALILGNWGFQFAVQTEDLGFMLFIFCVGIEAGPNFFSTFRQDGAKYIALALVVAAAGVASALMMTRLFDLGPGLAAGMLAGALTSTPTLVGAQDAVKQGHLVLQEGQTQAQIAADISVGYAITYVIGLVGILLVVRYLPKVFSLDLHAQATEIAEARGIKDESEVVSSRLPVIRAYLVDDELEQEFGGKTLRELGIFERTGCVIEKIRRDGQLLEPNSETVLKKNDLIALVGYAASHRALGLKRDSEVFDEDLLEFPIDVQNVVVKHAFADGKSLDTLGIDTNYGCFVNKLSRAQVSVPVTSDVILHKGDILQLGGERSRLNKLADKIGFISLRRNSADLVAFSFFMVLGLLLGQFKINLGELTVGLGTAGGLLFSGILMGFFRSLNPTFGHVPQGALNMLKDLGLMIFMVGIGLKAGAGILDYLLDVGPAVLLSGLVIMITPIIVGLLFGKLVLKLNPALLLGGLTGAMTSTAALNVINEIARSNIPSLGYAGAYTFANVFLTLAGAALIGLS